MGSFEVEFYVGKNDRSNVRDFVEECDVKLQRKILRQVLYVEEYGLNKAVPNLKKVASTNLWELRILGKQNIRLFCFQRDKVITVVHIFNKKSQKTPLNEIKIAEQRIRDLILDTR